MDLSKLDKLSTDALQKMRDTCQDILTKRNANAMRVGAVGWFLDGQGVKRFIRITRVNHKTVSGILVDEVTFMDLSAGRGQKWRVSPSLLNILDLSPKVKPSAAPAPVHRPTTSASAW